MTKADLKEAYARARDEYADGRLFTNEYALRLHTMLSDYLKMPLASPPGEGPGTG